MSDWIDRHSVTCHCCGELTDERETFSLTKEAGEICPSCSAKTEKVYRVAHNNILQYTSDVRQKDIIKELCCMIVQERSAKGNNDEG